MTPLPQGAEALCQELNQIHGRLFDLANHTAGNDRGNVALYLHEAANQIILALNCQERGNPADEPVPTDIALRSLGGPEILTEVLKDIMAPRPDRLRIKEPVVSIDRASKRYAFFDGFTPLQEFRPYTDEQAVIAEAQEFFRDVIDQLPRLVYPQITKLKATS